jgi:formylglycine-generating enzyme required for sulfatase activity
MGADPRAIVRRLEEEPDLTIRRALLLSLGEFGDQAFAPGERELLMQRLRQLYRNDPDPGLHAAAEWVLRTWKQDQWLRQTEQEWAKNKQRREQRFQSIRQELAQKKGEARPQWYVTGEGQTMVVIPGLVEFLMGSPTSEPWRCDDESLHRERIGHTFAIAAKAVTVDQYVRFRRDHSYTRQYAPVGDCPVHGMSWYEAAEYCNWLSEQEGLPQQEWCYERNKDGRYDAGMKPAPDYLKRTGYRLPTESEWEYACRAGAVTSRYYGQSEELLGKYCWYTKNSGDRSWPVGSLKPNDFGLFDMHGNVWAWCHDSNRSYKAGQGGKAAEDREDNSVVTDATSRVLRGGGFNYPPWYLRSAFRGWNAPESRDIFNGFRPARTYN